MTQRNPHIAHLSASYLFPEINRRKQEFLRERPTAKIISLGIGDTTEPLPRIITETLASKSAALATPTGYQGYGPEQGSEVLRRAISTTIYNGKVDPDDIFISDGSKCDIGRLQTLFGPNIKIALQDPAYPVYLDGSLIQGVKDVIPMPCVPENSFYPDIEHIEVPDIIYWCSPNNPTGATNTREQLKKLVDYALKNQALIIFDAAYASYIQDDTLPKSIYEIENADQVAIELGSFSKLAGFTGVRLGWSIVPAKLRYNDGTSIKNDWKRLISTIFNGASILSQAGGLAALSPEGMREIKKTTDFYMENAAILRNAIASCGYRYFGGDNAPYLWVEFPGMNSWDAFQSLLFEAEIISTPGSGFGPSGEGFLRFSAFGHRSAILEAAGRLNLMLGH